MPLIQKFHELAEFHAQIVCAAPDNFAIAFGGKTFVFKFFLASRRRHTIEMICRGRRLLAEKLSWDLVTPPILGRIFPFGSKITCGNRETVWF